jgi:hypothetical protein
MKKRFRRKSSTSNLMMKTKKTALRITILLISNGKMKRRKFKKQYISAREKKLSNARYRKLRTNKKEG